MTMTDTPAPAATPAKRDGQAELQDHCEQIAERLRTGLILDDVAPLDEGEEPSAYDFLQDALDIEYVVNSKGEYLGARVLVAFGGPNIWINTRSGMVEGAWWSSRANVPFYDGIGLDDALEELWNCR
jgi:hypothetical protein